VGPLAMVTGAGSGSRNSSVSPVGSSIR
jgi:hypothetical protein